MFGIKVHIQCGHCLYFHNKWYFLCTQDVFVLLIKLVESTILSSDFSIIYQMTILWKIDAVIRSEITKNLSISAYSVYHAWNVTCALCNWAFIPTNAQFHFYSLSSFILLIDDNNTREPWMKEVFFILTFFKMIYNMIYNLL